MRTRTIAVTFYSQVLYTQALARPHDLHLPLSVAFASGQTNPSYARMHVGVGRVRTTTRQPSMSRYTGEALARLWSMLWISLMFSLM